LARVRAFIENSLGIMEGPVFLWEPEQNMEILTKGMGIKPEFVRILNDPQHLPRRMAQDYPYEIDLIPPSLLKRRRAAFWIQAASFLFLLMSLATYPIAGLTGKYNRLNYLEKKIASAQKQAADLTKLRETNQNLATYLRHTADHVRLQPQVSEILKEITELLPDDVWVGSFVFANGQIILQGEAASATTVLELLENSPLLKDVRFESQIVRRKDVELYKIAAKIE